eukprot:COSAG04_NODE_451_length_14146_cov_611.491920_8_plen_80_part_00
MHFLNIYMLRKSSDKCLGVRTLCKNSVRTMYSYIHSAAFIQKNKATKTKYIGTKMREGAINVLVARGASREHTLPETGL